MTETTPPEAPKPAPPVTPPTPAPSSASPAPAPIPPAEEPKHAAPSESDGNDNPNSLLLADNPKGHVMEKSDGAPGDLSGVFTSTEKPEKSEGDISRLTGRVEEGFKKLFNRDEKTDDQKPETD